ncbi:MAG: hypothetical protein ABI555_00840, partial [Chloroflexota bacterium]
MADPVDDLGIDIFAGLESLADKSFVRIDTGGTAAGARAGGEGPDAIAAEPRFSLHPLLREYALECLETSGERPLVESRFADVFIALAERTGSEILSVGAEASLSLLDREERNLRAAIDWSLAKDRADGGLRIIGAVWRWFQQRGRLRENLALLGQLLARPAVDRRVRITGLTAQGGLAYWMNDFDLARTAYEERLDLATATGDPLLMADAHYDIGFMFMVSQEASRLREHEQLAIDLYTAAGREDGVLRARQALVLAVFLDGDYAAAQSLEEENLAVFRRTGSQFQIADSMTLLSGVHWRLGDFAAARLRVAESLQFFVEIDSFSGLARALGMVAIILLTEPGSDHDREFGAQVTGATYRLVRDHGVMLAPVKVLHLPDPIDLANELFGEARAAELMAEGAAISIRDL